MSTEADDDAMCRRVTDALHSVDSAEQAKVLLAAVAHAAGSSSGSDSSSGNPPPQQPSPPPAAAGDAACRHEKLLNLLFDSAAPAVDDACPGDSLLRAVDFDALPADVVADVAAAVTALCAGEAAAGWPVRVAGVVFQKGLLYVLRKGTPPKELLESAAGAVLRGVEVSARRVSECFGAGQQQPQESEVGAAAAGLKVFSSILLMMEKGWRGVAQVQPESLAGCLVALRLMSPPFLRPEWELARHWRQRNALFEQVTANVVNAWDATAEWRAGSRLAVLTSLVKCPPAAGNHERHARLLAAASVLRAAAQCEAATASPTPSQPPPEVHALLSCLLASYPLFIFTTLGELPASIVYAQTPQSDPQLVSLLAASLCSVLTSTAAAGGHADVTRTLHFAALGLPSTAAYVLSLEVWMFLARYAEPAFAAAAEDTAVGLLLEAACATASGDGAAALAFRRSRLQGVLLAVWVPEGSHASFAAAVEGLLTEEGGSGACVAAFAGSIPANAVRWLAEAQQPLFERLLARLAAAEGVEGGAAGGGGGGCAALEAAGYLLQHVRLSSDNTAGKWGGKSCLPCAGHAGLLNRPCACPILTLVGKSLLSEVVGKLLGAAKGILSAFSKPTALPPHVCAAALHVVGAVLPMLTFNDKLSKITKFMAQRVAAGSPACLTLAAQGLFARVSHQVPVHVPQTTPFDTVDGVDALLYSVDTSLAPRPSPAHHPPTLHALSHVLSLCNAEALQRTSQRQCTFSAEARQAIAAVWSRRTTIIHTAGVFCFNALLTPIPHSLPPAHTS